jgi:hypothetical protein
MAWFQALYQKGSFSVFVIFDDDTELQVYTSGDIKQNQVWTNYKITLPSSCIGKTVKAIRINHYMYNHGYWHEMSIR